MISGTVNGELEAVLCIAIEDAGGVVRDVEAVIDTGFNGMELMHGFELRIAVRRGGAVAPTAPPESG